MSKPQKQNGGATSKPAGQQGDPSPASPHANESSGTGYKKPPKEHQFAPGNKFGKGRVKGSQNLGTLVRKILGRKIPVKTADGSKKVSTIEVVLVQQAAKATKGDSKSAEKMIALYERYGPQEDLNGPAPEKLAVDIDAMRQFLAMQDYLNGNDGEDSDDEDA